MRITADIAAPTPSHFKQVWGGCNCNDSGLRTARSLFDEQLQWFVRDNYISLFDSIAQGEKRVHIINGSAGIGKSSFFIYALARIRLLGQCALLYFHARNAIDPIVVLFPKTGTPIEIPRDQLGKYREIVGQDKSYILVDGRVSFSEDDVDVTYIHAKSPWMEIGFFKKSNSYLHSSLVEHLEGGRACCLRKASGSKRLSSNICCISVESAATRSNPIRHSRW
mmetsp:Transcript_20951/g.34621  ORF Transcript_20951/g.34621 Transcript_20951/m.34621 type:complete len:223 (+) Transcript_20951:156-824(+)